MDNARMKKAAAHPRRHLAVILVWAGLALLVQTSFGEMIQGFIHGDQKVSGEIVGVRLEPSDMVVKIRVATGANLTPGVEADMILGNVESQSLLRVFAWIAQKARMNAGPAAELRFAPSAKAGKAFSPTKEASIHETTHSLAVMNVSSTTPKNVLLRRLVQQTSRTISRGRTTKEQTTWSVQSHSITGLLPGKTKIAEFMPLRETSHRSTRDLGPAGDPRIRNTTQETNEVKTDTVCLLALDDLGNVIYFKQF
ncbi:hypothetical protein BGE01nite_38370 [Brevifollis gellanilyticus]|uniref:Uncharacterized protein n=2 Tax=Brevifollis gellanilyticus TaxID=748831 RepID=A0A512MCU1_9BACT|nr:hypothetical protein BGE01nite_38370 [Brevifollis gellanilyticus]